MAVSQSSQDYLQGLFGQSGRTAVVTGASSGLGAEMARALVSAGAHVIAVARREHRLDALRDGAGGLAGTVTTCVADLGTDAGIDAVAGAVRDRSGCDVLVANAGTAEVGNVESMDDESFSRVMALNLNAQWRLAKALFPALVESDAGRVINIASIHGILAPVRPGLAAYAASKHALVGLTRTQAVEWAKHGITVNAIAPGYFPTEMTAELLASRAAKRLQQFVPMDRFGAPQELVSALLFLASPASGYVTGTVVPVDGGWSAW
ncbi:MAG: SDR family oxidoreductase [Gammaproteobacteria bacterium]|nr:SDR family oxidoreductase [Gammaproteobacteria bacterium]NIM72250.1 SDR family oxidoreductase [Gammaproteobacteria bacterium]NIN39165.1 SDR family oxidoreductase [Gammaproteobacteria bacterium]NIO23998.1 SDR family oxidoreductase [Gammaproteobacteria bacterium]NIO64650.1 SDR family oxidoreductase [Gammaproteobacteria bacterium]